MHSPTEHMAKNSHQKNTKPSTLCLGLHGTSLYFSSSPPVLSECSGVVSLIRLALVPANRPVSVLQKSALLPKEEAWSFSTAKLTSPRNGRGWTRVIHSQTKVWTGVTTPIPVDGEESWALIKGPTRQHPFQVRTSTKAN